ncbi:MAG TPA: gliding motility-associated C-terminal domain-containing protein [Bacteroidia bacterium]|nr:gliding motility-associated C-terminal domain-containing protein [Bacteroidia bacterium]
MKHLVSYVLLLLTLYTRLSEAQQNDGLIRPQSFLASNDIFGVRVFVENKGQFFYNNRIGDSTLFVYDDGAEKIHFTKSGIVHELNKVYVASEEQMEDAEKGKPIKLKPNEQYFVKMKWAGADFSHLSIEASEKQHHYMTYGGPEYNSACYKKITYRNVYPNTDVEFTVPMDKPHGIKYSVIFHSGADVSNYKVLYSGDAYKIKLKDGELKIRTPLEPIVEHTPSSFYQNGESLASEFLLNGDTSEILFPKGYDAGRDVVFDPWVTSVTGLSSHNHAFDVDYDFGGNTYIYGGSSPFKVSFYNMAGSLQWTFSGVVITPFWNGVTYPSNFGVDRLNSKTFIGQGWVTNPGASVVRLNSSGNYDNLITTPTSQYNEIWDFGFHCTTADVFILGGGTSSNITAATINTVNGSLNTATFNPSIANTNQDIVSHAIDDQGNLFVYYTGFAVNNKISKISPTFNGNLYLVPSGINVFGEFSNKSTYQGIVAGSSNGFNCLAVNANYLFYWDGATVAAYNKNTGSMVASSAISGMIAKRQGGIAVDDCNNIYLGGNGNIMCYNFNGTSFSSLTAIPIANSPYVYDLKLNRSTKMLYASGATFVGVFSAVVSNTCNSVISLCAFNQAGVAASSTSITCATLGSATVSANAGIGPFSYTWIPSGQTSSVATGLSPGTYTIVVYDAGSSSNYSTTVSFVSATPLSGSVYNSFMLGCNGVNNGTAAVTNLTGGSGNQSYLWTDGTTTYSTASVSGLGAGQYTVTVTDALTGCVFAPSFTIYAPPVLQGLISASSLTACVNTSISLNAIGSGGVPPYTYTFSTGAANSSLVVNHALASTYIYSLTLKDANNCTSTSTIALDYVPTPSLVVSNVSICPLETGTLSALGATSYTWNGVSTGSSFTANPLVNTQYTVLGSAFSCTSSTTASIILKPVPTPSFVSNSPLCQGMSLQFGASTGTAFVWSGVNGYTSSLQNNVLSAAHPSLNGQYQVTVTAANSCTASAQGSVTVYPTPTLSAAGSTVCVTQSVNLYGSSVAGASYVWTGPNAYVSLQQNPLISNPAVSASGYYTLKVTSPQGCTNTAQAHVTVTPMPVISFTSNSPQCTGKTLMFNASASTGALQYLWSGPNNFTSSLVNPNISNINLSHTGQYSLSLSAGPCSLSSALNVSVHPLPQPVAFNSGPVCEGKAFQLGVNSSGLTYSWTGPGTYSSSQQNISFSGATLNHTGLYSVLVTDANNCQNSSSTSLTVLQNPVLNATGEQVCFKEPALLGVTGASTYYWQGPASYTASGSGPIIPSAINTQVWTYTVTGTAQNGCTAVATATVNTWPLPVASITLNPRVCVKSTVYLKGQGGLLYHWEGPLGYLSDVQNPSFTAWNAGMSGNYTLMVTDANGCRGFSSAPLVVDPEPTGEIQADRLRGCVPFCSGFSVQTTGGAALHNTLWEIGQQVYNGAVLNHCFNQPGNVEIKTSFESDQNCKGNLSLIIEVYPLPEAGFTYSPAKPVENQDLVFFTNQSKGEYQSKWTWSFNDGGQRKGENCSYLFSEAGVYVIALQVENKWACADTLIKTIEVLPDYNVYVPNAFTPNGDGLNDTFFPVLRGVKTFQMDVFDRWGALIFGSNSPEHVWDGTYRGEACKQDVYNYRLHILNNRGEEKDYTGNINLYR